MNVKKTIENKVDWTGIAMVRSFINGGKQQWLCTHKTTKLGACVPTISLITVNSCSLVISTVRLRSALVAATRIAASWDDVRSQMRSAILQYRSLFVKVINTYAWKCVYHFSTYTVQAAENRRKPQIYREDREGTVLTAIKKPSARRLKPSAATKIFVEPQRTAAWTA